MERSYGEEEGGRERARDEEKGRRREGKRYGYTAMTMMVLPCSSSSNMAAVPVGTRPGLCKPLGTGALGPIPACGDYREERGGEGRRGDMIESPHSCSLPSFHFSAHTSFLSPSPSLLSPFPSPTHPSSLPPPPSPLSTNQEWSTGGGEVFQVLVDLLGHWLPQSIQQCPQLSTGYV